MQIRLFFLGFLTMLVILYIQMMIGLCCCEDDNQEKLYTAAILMSEYGPLDSSDMDDE